MLTLPPLARGVAWRAPPHPPTAEVVAKLRLPDAEFVVDTSDDIADGIHFNMSMDSFDCEAYFFARVYNRTDGQNTNMFDRTNFLF